MMKKLHFISCIILPALVSIIIGLQFNRLAAGLNSGMSSNYTEWQDEFNLSQRQLSDEGKSTYFILIPGFQTILEHKSTRLIITVLNQTKVVCGVTTRVVEERELKNGELYEISRNFYAIDTETGDAFYFGEEVDYYKDGEVINHEGAWMADESDNRPGMIMPGNPQTGMKYYQELAPGVAMDRAKVISTNKTFTTPLGEFTNCLETEESSKIKTLLFFNPTETKIYAPEIGLIKDESLRLIGYGYLSFTEEK